MSDWKRKQPARLGAWVGSMGAGAVLVACGPRPPPPHIVEVPIDQFQAAPGPAPTGDPSSSTPPPIEVSTTESTTEAPATGGTRAAPVATPQAPPTSVPPGQRLTAAECSRIVDKGAVLYGVSQGMSVTKAMKALTSLRSQAQADPTYAKVHGSCAEQNSKPQYGCAMKAGNLDKWKACVE